MEERKAEKMKARVIQNGGGKSHLEIEPSEIPDRLMSSKLLVAGLINGLRNSKLKHAQETYNMVHQVIEAINAMPAHSGYGTWFKQNDFKPKGWKWVCSNCQGLCYAMPNAEQTCVYDFCPHCGCRMVDELPDCMEVGE